MTKKEAFRNEILLKMKYQLDKNELAMLEEALSESHVSSRNSGCADAPWLQSQIAMIIYWDYMN